MYTPFQLLRKFLRYYFTASNGRGHGIHSPFVFDFIIHVLNDKRNFYFFEKIEGIRSILKSDTRMLEIEDFGAGSVFSKTKKRAIGDIARSALKPKKFGQLLFRIVNYYQPAHIVELGTSLGITAAYLAAANSHSQIWTLEGAANVASVAAATMQAVGLKNVTIITGNFDDTLPALLSETRQADFVFIDGNHRREPTLRYFELLMRYTNEYSILVFDDIHWSKEMEAAWEEIKSDSRVKLTIDLFFIGLVFFRSDFRVKQHFTIRF